MFPGIADRMQKELTTVTLAPSSVKVRLSLCCCFLKAAVSDLRSDGLVSLIGKDCCPPERVYPTIPTVTEPMDIDDLKLQPTQPIESMYEVNHTFDPDGSSNCGRNLEVSRCVDVMSDDGKSSMPKISRRFSVLTTSGCPQMIFQVIEPTFIASALWDWSSNFGSVFFYCMTQHCPNRGTLVLQALIGWEDDEPASCGRFDYFLPYRTNIPYDY
jgi:hypothetical protein